MGSVDELVDRVLADIPPALRDQCIRDRILEGLAAAGACDVSVLGTLLEQDYSAVKGAIGTAAPVAFVAMLKQAVLNQTAAPAATANTPTGVGFATPSGAVPAAAALRPMAVTVKLGSKTLVSARMISVADETTNLAALLQLALDGVDEAERTMLSSLPVKVAAFRGAQLLPNQKVDVELSSPASQPASLGYHYILFSYAPPAERPAAQPSASFFDRMQGADHLPDRETHDVGCTLTFDKALYNWIIELCRADSLGVRSDEVASCSRLLKAVRDALQAIDGREGAFRYARVPARWKEYTKLTGDQAIKRAKRPAKSLQWTRVQQLADAIRAAIDRPAFTRQQLWSDFVGDCEELYEVLRQKVEDMRGHATAQAERQARPTVWGCAVLCRAVSHRAVPCRASLCCRAV